MDLTAIELMLTEQQRLLGHDKVETSQNRKGLRQQTGLLLQEAFLELAVGLSPDLSIEVGAHEAGFSTAIKESIPNLRALAFEANPYVFEKYSGVLSESTGHTIQYEHVAICDHNGFVDLKIPVSWPKGRFGQDNAISSLHLRYGNSFEYETARVPARTLDSAIGPTAFDSCVMWIDAEGAQREVIAGGGNTLSRVSALFIEVEHEQVWVDQETANGISGLLKRFGLIPVMRDNLARLQRNEVYVRHSKRVLDVSTPIIDGYVRNLAEAI